MFCANCGQAMEEGAAFCPNCGAKTAGQSQQPGVSEKELKRMQKKQKRKVLYEAVFHPEATSTAVSMTYSFLLGFFILLFLIISMTSFVIRYTVKSGAVFQAAESMDLEELNISDIISEDVLEDTGVNIAEGDTAYDLLGNILFSSGDNSRVARKVIDNSTIRSFISETINNYANYIITGKTTESVTAKSLMRLVDENQSVFSEYLGYEIPEEVIDELGDKGNRSIVNAFDPEKTLEDVSAVRACRFLFSPVLTVIFFIVAMITGVFLATLTNRLKYALTTFGVCFSVTGLVMFVIPAFVGKENGFVRLIMQAVTPARVTCGLGLLIVAMAFFLTVAIMNIFRRGADKNEA